jgi:hypothetical protein
VDKPVTFSEPVLADQLALPLREARWCCAMDETMGRTWARQFPVPREGRSPHR